MPFINLIVTGDSPSSGKYHHLHDIYPEFHFCYFTEVYFRLDPASKLRNDWFEKTFSEQNQLISTPFCRIGTDSYRGYPILCASGCTGSNGPFCCSRQGKLPCP